jgi:hypothetical protein
VLVVAVLRLVESTVSTSSRELDPAEFLPGAGDRKGDARAGLAHHDRRNLPQPWRLDLF